MYVDCIVVKFFIIIIESETTQEKNNMVSKHSVTFIFIKTS